MRPSYLLIGLMAAALLLSACSPGASEAKYTNVTSEQLLEMMGSRDIFVVDVHIPEQEHIKGTDAFIPYNEIGNRLDELPADKNSAIALYCRSGSMSKEAAETLSSLGYTNVYNHLGGTNDWREKGLEFE